MTTLRTTTRLLFVVAVVVLVEGVEHDVHAELVGLCLFRSKHYALHYIKICRGAKCTEPVYPPSEATGVVPFDSFAASAEEVDD